MGGMRDYREEYAAQRALLDALACGVPAWTAVARVEDCRRSGFEPDIAMLKLAADAVERSGGGGWRTQELRSRFLSDVQFKNERRLAERTTYALLAAAATAAGVEPDVLDDTNWWQETLTRYAALAAVAYVRALAESEDCSVSDLCEELAAERVPSPKLDAALSEIERRFGKPNG
jgi:hypothetical protein